jgi:hypothetical protein
LENRWRIGEEVAKFWKWIENLGRFVGEWEKRERSGEEGFGSFQGV